MFLMLVFVGFYGGCCVLGFLGVFSLVVVFKSEVFYWQCLWQMKTAKHSFTIMLRT